MKSRSVSHLGDQELARALGAKVGCELLADRFPKSDVPTRVERVSGSGVSSCQTLVAARPVETLQSQAARTEQAQAPKMTPLSPGRFALQVTIAESTCDKLEYAQALLGHQVPSGDVAVVLDRALDALIAGLEKSKFAVTSKPRPARSSADPRHIPAHVKRAVLERDGGHAMSAMGGVAAVRQRHAPPLTQW